MAAVVLFDDTRVIYNMEEQIKLKQEVEMFLFEEAWMLDNWDLWSWFELFAPEARYVVPATDLPEGDPERDLVFINDNMQRLESRVERLLGQHGHREKPKSRTRRFISNVRAKEEEETDLVKVTASFLVYRFRLEENSPFVGHYKYHLKRSGSSFKILYRKAQLDLELLTAHGGITIIL